MASEAYYSREYFNQQRRMLINGDPRALICFCIDVSESMREYWIQEGGLVKHTGSGFADGHNVNYFDKRDIRPGYAFYQKINKLNDALCSLLSEFKNDSELRGRVAVSIVTYSRFANVKYDFLDCEALDINSCRFNTEAAETSMGDGLRTALAQIDEMQNEMRNADNDFYTPILVFMTDGTPTDDPRPEFEKVRERVENGLLHIFPLGIGNGADMYRLRDMFPLGHAPANFSESYKMVAPADYDRIFREIKNHVVRRESVMVSEGNSEQSAPALEESDVVNNQMGEAIDWFSLV